MIIVESCRYIFWLISLRHSKLSNAIRVVEKESRVPICCIHTNSGVEITFNEFNILCIDNGISRTHSSLHLLAEWGSLTQEPNYHEYVSMHADW